MTALIVIGSIVAYLAAAAATFRHSYRRLLNNAVLAELESRRERAIKTSGAYGSWAKEQMAKPVDVSDEREGAAIFASLAGLFWPGFWLLWVPGAYAVRALTPRTDDLPALKAHQREIAERAELEQLRKVAKREGWDWAVDGPARDEKGKGSTR